MSEVKRNVWFEPLPDYLKEGPLVFVVTWHAPKENHDKIAEHMRDGMDIQRAAPSKVGYSRTRTWFKPSEDMLALLVPRTGMTPVLYSEVGGTRIEFERYMARSTVIAHEIQSQTS